MPSQSSSKTQHPLSLDNIPPGYTSLTMGDGRQVIIPTVLMPDVQYALAAYQKKQDNNIVNAKPRFSQFEDVEQQEMAGGLFNYPTDPLLSDQEKLSLHAEVLALQAQLGISYKDASHRLYMVEVEKLKMADKDAKAWGCLSHALQDTLKNINMDSMKNNHQEGEGEGAKEAEGIEGGEGAEQEQ